MTRRDEQAYAFDNAIPAQLERLRTLEAIFDARAGRARRRARGGREDARGAGEDPRGAGEDARGGLRARLRLCGRGLRRRLAHRRGRVARQEVRGDQG
jgi:hypothetical protein